MSSTSDTPPRERGPHEVFCRNCGDVIDREAEICPSCGVRQRPPPKSSTDSAVEDLLEGGNPFVAALLSAIFPGLGQIYNRELERGLAFVVVTILAALSTLVFVGFLLFPAVWLFAIYDAYTRAELRAEELRAEKEALGVPVTESTGVETTTADDDETDPTADDETDEEDGIDEEDGTDEEDTVATTDESDPETEQTTGDAVADETADDEKSS